MEYEKAKNLAEKINRSPINRDWLTPAKNQKGNDGYCCPFCSSGTGKNQTGALTLYDDHCYCFSCKRTIRNMDLAAKRLGIEPKGKDFYEVLKYCCNEMGIPYIETESNRKNFSTSEMKKRNEGVKAVKKQPEEEKETPEDYSVFYKCAQSRLAEFINAPGGSWRGLSYGDLQAVGAGFNEKKQCVIFPHNQFSYFERSITDTPKTKKHHGKKVVYNPYEVLECKKPIFIVEGEIDCISIHKFGYPCIALGGAAEKSLLMKTLDAKFSGVAKKPDFIVLFDNNDSGAGQKAATELIKALRDAGYLAVNFILSPDFQYDANEFLQKDSASFSARLKEIYEKAEIELLEAENKIFGTKLNFFFRHRYQNFRDRYSRFETLKTGFSELDRVQDFESCLIVLGAPPSLGKTSFLFQLFGQIAKSGNKGQKTHCFFASFEMSDDVLFSKSMARGIFNLCRKNNLGFELGEELSSTRIRKGIVAKKYVEACVDVWEQLSEDDSDLRVLDFTTSTIGIDELIGHFEKIAAALPKEDVLIFGIDYLQRIPNDQETAKSAVDYAMTKLKQFSQRTNSIVFLISSYNRNSYRTEASFDAFKESGSIEYGADVIWALQLHSVDKNGKFSLSQSDIDSAKMKQPRPMILKCLKNRFGNIYKLYFQYYPAVDTFVECSENDFND